MPALWLSLAILVACDRGEEPTPAAAATPSADAKKAPDEGEPKTAAAASPEAKVDAPEIGTPPSPPVEPGPPPEVAKATTDGDRLRALAEDAAASGDASKVAWTHLEAKRYAQAQAFFARATVDDRGPWKHPFNLACASALAKDDEMARIALTEALHRDAPSVIAKARRDADLASVRTSKWFEPLLADAVEAMTDSPGASLPSPLAAVVAVGTTGETPTEPSPAAGEDAPPAGEDTPPAGEDTPPIAEAPPTPAVAPTEEDHVVEEPPKRKEPQGKNVPLAKAQLTTLRDALTAKHGVKAVVKSSLLVTPTSADPIAFAVYEYSQFDECMKTGTKKECRERFRGDPEMAQTNDMRCTKAWLVRAELGASVTLGEPVKVTVPCTIGRVRALFEADVDADGKSEIVVDVIGKRETEGFREGAETYANRTVRILRLDGTSQFDLDVGWVLIEYAAGEETSKRYGVVDDDGDGHPDLEVQTVEFLGQDTIEFDGVLWPAFDVPEIQGVSVQVLRYSAATDAWVAK